MEHAGFTAPHNDQIPADLRSGELVCRRVGGSRKEPERMERFVVVVELAREILLRVLPVADREEEIRAGATTLADHLDQVLVALLRVEGVPVCTASLGDKAGDFTRRGDNLRRSLRTV